MDEKRPGTGDLGLPTLIKGPNGGDRRTNKRTSVRLDARIEKENEGGLGDGPKQATRAGLGVSNGKRGTARERYTWEGKGRTTGMDIISPRN